MGRGWGRGTCYQGDHGHHFRGLRTYYWRNKNRQFPKETAVLLVALWDVHRLKVSQETIRRRWLLRENMVWRRPRPVPTDEQRTWKLRKIRELLRDLPADA